MRVVQEGAGSPRPLVLVYHLSDAADAALKNAAAPTALIVNDTRTNLYVDVPTLPATVAALEAQYQTKLAPVILAGFSQGGLTTRQLLDRGADPDVLIIADGTYGTDYRSWRRFADLAKARLKLMLASYSSNMQPVGDVWSGLKAVTGFPLGIRAGVGTPVIAEPTKYEEGSLVVLGYPDLDHAAQGRVVLPKMIAAAFDALTVKPPTRTRVAGLAIAAIGAMGAVVWWQRPR